MKREVFISILFLLGLNISGSGLIKENHLININCSNVLDKLVPNIKPKVFVNKSNNSTKLSEEKKYYLLPANSSEQNSKNNFQATLSPVFILAEGNSGIKIIQRKTSYGKKKETKNKSIIIKPNSNLIKVPP